MHASTCPVLIYMCGGQIHTVPPPPPPHTYTCLIHLFGKSKVTQAAGKRSPVQVLPALQHLPVSLPCCVATVEDNESITCTSCAPYQCLTIHAWRCVSKNAGGLSVKTHRPGGGDVCRGGEKVPKQLAHKVWPVVNGISDRSNWTRCGKA